MGTFLTIVILAVIPAVIASSKGYSGFAWWIYGCLLLPVAFVHSLVLHKNIDGLGMKSCLFCAEAIKGEATVCRYCGKDQPANMPFMMTPVAPSPIRPPKPPAPMLRMAEKKKLSREIW